jgi:hypothetical protein
MSIRQIAYPETETEIKTSHFKFKKLKKKWGMTKTPLENSVIYNVDRERRLNY